MQWSGSPKFERSEYGSESSRAATYGAGVQSRLLEVICSGVASRSLGA